MVQTRSVVQAADRIDFFKFSDWKLSKITQHEHPEQNESRRKTNPAGAFLETVTMTPKVVRKTELQGRKIAA